MRMSCITMIAALATLRPHPAAALHRDEARPRTDIDAAAKVERLLSDVDESVKKSGADAEVVFATLYSYDQQLEESLTGEVEKKSKDLTKLKDWRKAYEKTLERTSGAQHGIVSKSRHHPAAAGVSLVQTTSGDRSGSGATAEFSSALASVQQLVSHTQSGSNPDELAFSTTFMESVLNIDRGFAAKVHDSIRRKAELVNIIRNSRQAQHKTLAALLDLLRGRYKVDGAGAEDTDADDVAPAGSISFLQTRAASREQGQSQPAHQLKVSSLQYQIEGALKRKEDTHAILLRIKGMLDETAPVNADSVQDLMSELGGVLRSVNAVQSTADQAKQKCESQKKHASLEEQGLRTNMALMDGAHNHTKAAIKAAKSNLQRIVAKTKDLQLSTEEFSKIVAKTTATLEDQSQDRRMIMTAVEKARDIVAQLHEGGPAASALLEQMLKELQEQQAGEHSYRTSEVAFRGSFLGYAQSYLQLLRESRGHYEISLSALELYADEVQGDVAAQMESLATGKELQKESAELCRGILRFHGRHKRRREELSQALRSVLPDVPAVLGKPAARA